MNKYPVTTDRGVYLAEIHRSYVVLGMFEFVVSIYVKRHKQRWYQKEHVRVHKYESGWRRYDEVSKDLIGFVKEAVNDYESQFDEEVEREAAIKAFDEWDGDMR